MKTIKRIIALVVLALPAQLVYAGSGTDASDSYIELYGGYTGGGFKSSSQALTAWNAGLKSGFSGMIIPSRLSVRGTVSFDRFKGEGMGGSMFIRPGMYPVDFIESQVSPKEKNTLKFDAGLSSVISDGWTFNCGVNALAASYRRISEFHHDNTRSEISLSPGLAFHPEGRPGFEFSYLLHRECERIRVALDEDAGASSYEVFVDEGLLYGPNAAWNDPSVMLCTSGLDGMPAVEWSNGLSLKYLGGVFSAGAVYKYTSGRMGEGGNVFYRFPGHALELNAGASFKGGKLSHRPSLTLALGSRVSDDVSGESPFRLYGRQSVSVKPRYSVSDGRYRINASLVAAWTGEESTPAGPKSYSQDTWTYLFDLNASRTFGRLACALDMAFGDGLSEFVYLDNPSFADAAEPYRLEKYWLGMMDYITAKHVRINPSVSFDLLENGKCYLRLDGHFTKAFELQIIKKQTRYDAFLTVGYRL